MNKEAVIEFYRTGDEYGCFSNFSAHPIAVGGKVWPTSEHYFQAQKFAERDPRTTFGLSHLQ